MLTQPSWWKNDDVLMYCDVFCLFLSCFYPWALVSIRTHYMLPKRAVVSLDVVSSDLCYTAHSSQISKLLPQCSDFRSDELTIHVDFKSKCQWQKHTVASLERSVSRFVVCCLSVPNEMWATISPYLEMRADFAHRYIAQTRQNFIEFSLVPR